ncbi:unnamed protein product, partial [Polarella glacialis]
MGPVASEADDEIDALFSSDTEDEAQGAAKLQKRVAEATALKAEGNSLLQQGRAGDAACSYRKALSAVWADYRRRSAPEASALGLAIDLNLSLCHLKLEEWEAARRCAERALGQEPGNVK